jgi:hypothetical protein
MIQTAIRVSVIFTLAFASAVRAYDPFVHDALTTRAVEESVFPDRLVDLGLENLDQQLDDFTRDGRFSVIEYCIPRVALGKRSVMRTIVLGAFCEDNLFGDSKIVRVRYHFFDPTHNGEGLLLAGTRYQSSLLWGRDSANVVGQTFAYNNAQDYLEQSVTAATESQRNLARVKYLRTLGHLLHLVQDLAQPQHTRQDSHGAGSAYEKYVDLIVQRALGNFSIDDYPVVGRTDLSEYWTTKLNDPFNGKGLADFTNTQFVTAGKNFRGTPANVLPNADQPYPDGQNVTLGPWLDVTTLGCMSGEPVGSVRFGTMQVKDNLTGVSSTMDRGTSYTILAYDLDQRFPQYAGSGSFGMNKCNYDQVQKIVFPAAVGNSAGLINYIMRGQMAITAPDTGFFGIVDHSAFSSTDVNGGFVGFNKIKLKLKNVSKITLPDNTVVPQDMPGGALTAVVKFRRNTCYDDLLDNWPLNGTTAQPCLSPTEEIVISDPFEAPMAVPLGSANNPDGTEISFTFAQNVPINAWNVVLQVIYRGQLGSEDNAVVVAAKDLSEPTFIGFFNTTDYVLINGVFYKPSNLTQSQFTSDVHFACRAGTPGNYTLSTDCYNKADNFAFNVGSSSVTIGSSGGGSPTIPFRRFGRMAFLGDIGNSLKFSWTPGAVNCWHYLANPITLASYRSQIDSQGGGPYFGPTSLRGVQDWLTVSCFSDAGATPTPIANVNLQQLDALNGIERRPVQMDISGW